MNSLHTFNHTRANTRVNLRAVWPCTAIICAKDGLES